MEKKLFYSVDVEPLKNKHKLTIYVRGDIWFEKTRYYDWSEKEIQQIIKSIKEKKAYKYV